MTKREHIPDTQINMLLGRFQAKQEQATGDLVRLIRHTGMRPCIEALTSPLKVSYAKDKYLALTIQKGKGGKKRTIPIVDSYVINLLTAPDKMSTIREIPYDTHARRFARAVKECAITSSLPSLHAIRHSYAVAAYRKTKDFWAVKRLLGHSKVETTTTYLAEVYEMDELAERLS